MIKNVAIAFLYIIHISALIGIYFGHIDFFMPKSIFTILYIFAILVYFYPVRTTKKLSFFLLCFLTGMTTEWIGVHKGMLFGDYHYLPNMGLAIDGIPLAIGLNWAILVFITHAIASHLIKNKWLIMLTAAMLMVLLDFFLEQICEYAGFWVFKNGAGWYNYLCWFIIGFILQFLAFQFKLSGDKKISFHLYLVQIIFTALLWVIITT